MKNEGWIYAGSIYIIFNSLLIFYFAQDHKLRLNPNGVAELVDAKRGGNLHETLLDRREKMKSDRMCK